MAHTGGSGTSPRDWFLIVHGRDTWKEEVFDRLEGIVRGRIVSHRDNGAGALTLVIRPNVKPAKATRRDVESALKAMNVKGTWNQL